MNLLVQLQSHNKSVMAQDLVESYGFDPSIPHEVRIYHGLEDSHEYLLRLNVLLLSKHHNKFG